MELPGYYSHLGEINDLISVLCPYVRCFQETKFLKFYIPYSKNFNIHFKHNINSDIACGGVANYIHKQFDCLELPLTTNIQVVASIIYFPSKITICNIYLPPTLKFTKNDIVNIINQLPSPFIICGDFNSHNNLWGSDKTEAKGKIIETVLNDLDLSLMNSPNNPTHFCTYSGKFSFIDLTIISLSLQVHFSWNTHSDLCWSDHFPRVLNLFHPKIHPNFSSQIELLKINIS